jgi:hypothetical protein
MARLRVEERGQFERQCVLALLIPADVGRDHLPSSHLFLSTNVGGISFQSMSFSTVSPTSEAAHDGSGRAASAPSQEAGFPFCASRACFGCRETKPA